MEQYDVNLNKTKYDFSTYRLANYLRQPGRQVRELDAVHSRLHYSIITSDTLKQLFILFENCARIPNYYPNCSLINLLLF